METETSNFKRENKCFQISCYFKDYLALATPISTDIIKLFNTIQKHPKITHKTLCKNYEQGGLKSVDISSRIASLQCS